MSEGFQHQNLKGNPPTLFVLMGASNLARGYDGIADCLRNVLGPQTVEILAAMGPGRGYCAEGGILNARYAPILRSGILEAAEGLKTARGCRVLALITDIGNDIMYGVSAEEIIASLDCIFKKLRAMQAEVLVTSIHVDLEHDVGEDLFNLLARIFYPKSSLTWKQAIVEVRKVNHFLESRSVNEIHLIRGMEAYCGGDRIHYSLDKSFKGWTRVLEKCFGLLGAAPSFKIHPLEMLRSLWLNFLRVFCVDMLHVRRPRPGLY